MTWVEQAVTLVVGDNNNVTLNSGVDVLKCSAVTSTTVTGVTGGVTGRTLYIYNNTVGDITITNQDANSTNVNRFAISGGNNHVIISPTSGRLFYYTGSRWVTNWP